MMRWRSACGHGRPARQPAGQAGFASVHLAFRERLSDKRILFESSRGTSHATRDPHAVRIDFADHPGILSFARGPNYRSELSQARWGVLLSGIALSLLLGFTISGVRTIGELRRQVRAAQRAVTPVAGV
jgi:hypothetical protein